MPDSPPAPTWEDRFNELHAFLQTLLESSRITTRLANFVLDTNAVLHAELDRAHHAHFTLSSQLDLLLQNPDSPRAAAAAEALAAALVLDAAYTKTKAADKDNARVTYEDAAAAEAIAESKVV